MTVLFVTRVRRAERLIFTERCIAERSYLNGKPFVSLFMTLTYPDHQELKTFLSLPVEFSVTYLSRSLILSGTVFSASVGVPRRQSHRRSGLANLPSVGAVP